MSKSYFVVFGTGSPATNTGLTPTLTVFKNAGGSAITAPGVTEIPTSTGIYYFTYTPTNAIAFVCDGGSSLATPTRYVSGSLDPVDAVDEQLSAFGSSLNTYIGTTASSFGNTATDPATVFGYLKRLQEFNEGNSNFNKTSGAWDIYSRGSSTLLIEKIVSDAGGSVTKT